MGHFHYRRGRKKEKRVAHMEQWEVGEGMQVLKEFVPTLLLCKCSMVTLGPSNVNFNLTGNSMY